MNAKFWLQNRHRSDGLMEGSKDLSGIKFTNKIFDDGKCPANMNELVTAWLSYEARHTKKAISEGRWHANQREIERLDDFDAQGTDDEEFFWAFQCQYDLSDEYPDLALEFVREVLKRKPPKPILAILAAGPLEEVLANHGLAVIDWVESEACRNPQFRHLLGGVWKNAMTDEIWGRVNRIAPEKW